MFRLILRMIPALALLVLAACGTSAPPAAQTTSPAASVSPSEAPTSSQPEGTTDSERSTAAPSGAASSSAASATGPVTVTDGRGRTVELPAPATKVIALEWGEAETLVSLGADLVGLADPKGFSTWNTAVTLPEGVKDVGMRAEPSIESIMALEPDLVVLNGTASSALEKQLEGKIPVVFTKGSAAGQDLERLRSDVTLLAQATGKTAEGEKLLADMDAALAEATSRVEKAGATGTPFLMADGWKEGSVINIRVFAKGSMVDEIATAMGLRNAWTQPGDADWGLMTTDVEGVSGMTDEKLRLFYSASEDDVFAEGLAANPIWKSLPFVKSQRIHKFTAGTWTFGGPASVTSVAGQIASAVESEQ